jgi:hypothetical protein
MRRSQTKKLPRGGMGKMSLEKYIDKKIEACKKGPFKTPEFCDTDMARDVYRL